MVAATATGSFSRLLCGQALRFVDNVIIALLPCWSAGGASKAPASLLLARCSRLLFEQAGGSMTVPAKSAGGTGAWWPWEFRFLFHGTCIFVNVLHVPGLTLFVGVPPCVGHKLRTLLSELLH